MLYGIIPVQIRHNGTISDKAKLLYAELTANCNEKRECTLSNDVLGEYLSCAGSTVRYLVSELRDLELISVEVNGPNRSITFPEHLVIVEGNAREKATQPNRRVDLTEEIVKDWNKKWGTRMKATHKLVSSVTARAKVFSDEEIKQAIQNRIDNVENNTWYDDPKNARHKTRLDLVLGNDDDLDKYLNMKPIQQKDSFKSMRFN
jgi:hypothetical protein